MLSCGGSQGHPSDARSRSSVPTDLGWEGVCGYQRRQAVILKEGIEKNLEAKKKDTGVCGL